MSLLSFYVDLFRYAKAALECLERSPPPLQIIRLSFFNISFTVCNLVSLPCTDILTQHYSTIKQGEILTFATTWMDLENIMLSKISQTETNNNHDFTHMWDIKQKQQMSKPTKISWTYSTMQYRDDVQHCTLETYVILITNDTPINLIIIKKNEYFVGVFLLYLH